MNPGSYWLSRVTPRDELSPTQLVRLGGLSPYGQHKALWRLFEGQVVEDEGRFSFLFRAEERIGLPRFYLLSRIEPRDLDGSWSIETKRFVPDIRPGDHLSFQLRANPTVSRASEPGARGKRHDVVMDAKRRMDWKKLPPGKRPSLGEVAQQAGTAWLKAKEERLGVSFEDGLIATGYRVEREMGGKGANIATLDFSGTLAVVDEAALRDALLRGVGAAKGLGCGLMLVKRVHP